jgi:hypothetical protein
MLKDFTKQWRDELIGDLGMNPKTACPKCCINYVTGSFENTCRYELVADDYDSDEEITEELLAEKFELVCVYDYDGDEDRAAIIRDWIKKVLELCYEVGGEILRYKWMQKFAAYN